MCPKEESVVMHRGRVIEYFEKRFAHMVRISRNIQRCSMPQTMYRKPAVRSVLLFDGNVENIFNRHSHQRMTAPGKTRRNMPYNICFLQISWTCKQTVLTSFIQKSHDLKRVSRNGIRKEMRPGFFRGAEHRLIIRPLRRIPPPLLN